MSSRPQRPSAVVHADWSKDPKKQWMARAILKDGIYVAHAPERVGDASTLIHRLHLDVSEEGTILVGFDFPIGLPSQYADKIGIENFVELLPFLGHGEWSEFYCVAERAEQISLHRPFYPQRPGGTKMNFLLEALRIKSKAHLLRRCEEAHNGLPEAAPLFWTMGPKQVGKAAISGWRDVLAPALQVPDFNAAVWPFKGALNELLQHRKTVIVETYPAEFYLHLGLNVKSKKDQADRRANASVLLQWANEIEEVALSPEMYSTVEDGFGSRADGEDRFDAAVGLFGILNVVLGHRDSGEPEDCKIRNVEGWMLGRLTYSNG